MSVAYLRFEDGTGVCVSGGSMTTEPEDMGRSPRVSQTSNSPAW